MVERGASFPDVQPRLGAARTALLLLQNLLMGFHPCFSLVPADGCNDTVDSLGAIRHRIVLKGAAAREKLPSYCLVLAFPACRGTEQELLVRIFETCVQTEARTRGHEETPEDAHKHAKMLAPGCSFPSGHLH